MPLWVNWPANERTGGPPASPMDSTFFDRWYTRQKLLRNRAAVPGVLVSVTETPPWPIVLNPVGDAGEIYVPPWADGLTATVRLVATAGINGFQGYVVGGLRVGFVTGVFVRFLGLGTFGVFSEVLTVTLPGEFLEPHRDQVVNAQWEYYVERQTGGLATISFRYFALSPTRRLPWHWAASGL